MATSRIAYLGVVRLPFLLKSPACLFFKQINAYPSIFSDVTVNFNLNLFNIYATQVRLGTVNAVKYCVY
jgi:hypothetical protein